MSSGLIKVLSGVCDIRDLCLVECGRVEVGEASFPGNIPLGQVLPDWSTYADKPMTKEKVGFIVILFGLWIV